MSSQSAQKGPLLAGLPRWVPAAAQVYLAHACAGRALRDVASAHGCAPSTVLRQVRRLETRRDDPLVDDALDRLAAAILPAADADAPSETDGDTAMSAMPSRAALIDDDTLNREAARILRRLCEGDAVLVVGQGMDQAVVLKGEANPTRIATLSRAVAQAFVLKDWIGCFRAGKVTRYRITDAGRAALRRLLADRQSRRAAARAAADTPSPFLVQQGEHVLSAHPAADGAEPTRINLAESPLGALARRRDRDGKTFLTPDLVRAGETLREDFERAQMSPRVGQNWERFLTAGTDGGAPSDAGGSCSARERVAVALRALGPGLGDVVLRVCCFLEGIEATEKRMGWAARSGKIVLRIGLQRLQMHYGEVGRL